MRVRSVWPVAVAPDTADGLQRNLCHAKRARTQREERKGRGVSAMWFSFEGARYAVLSAAERKRQQKRAEMLEARLALAQRAQRSSAAQVEELKYASPRPASTQTLTNCWTPTDARAIHAHAHAAEPAPKERPLSLRFGSDGRRRRPTALLAWLVKQIAGNS